MPSLGNAFYPTIPITEAIEAVEAVERDFRGSITTSGLASQLGMKETGGAFRHKLTALHRYDLVSGRGTLTVTALGQRIAHPATPAERQSAVADSFLNIELFHRLRDRFRDAAPAENQFRIVLEELTGASRRDISAKLKRIRRLYLDGLQYVTPSPVSPPEEAGQEDGGTTEAAVRYEDLSADRATTRIILNDGNQRFDVERSPRGLELLRKFLLVMEEQLRMEEVAAEEEDGDTLE